ncbi:MAG: ATP-binding cassette domain-containing protein, partial [Pseudomonadota bacterium]
MLQRLRRKRNHSEGVLAAEDPLAGRDLTGTLIARGLTKSYRGRRVVDGASMAVRAGQIVGLLGPNGAGKTTSFYMVTGLVPVDAGQIMIDGLDVTHLPM